MSFTFIWCKIKLFEVQVRNVKSWTSYQNVLTLNDVEQENNRTNVIRPETSAWDNLFHGIATWKETDAQEMRRRNCEILRIEDNYRTLQWLPNVFLKNFPQLHSPKAAF